jgi:hypothetical protein
MLKPERLSRLPTKPLDRQRRPHPYHKSPGPQGRAWQGARRWQQSASLCHSCPFLRWSAHSWHVAAICRAGPPFADRNVTNVFNRRCMHAQMLISGQSSTNLSLPRHVLGHKALFPRDSLLFTSFRRTSECRIVWQCAWTSS